MAPPPRRRGGFGPVLALLLLVILGALVALALRTPPYRPRAVEQPVAHDRLPL